MQMYSGMVHDQRASTGKGAEQRDIRNQRQIEKNKQTQEMIEINKISLISVIHCMSTQQNLVCRIQIYTYK